MDNQDSPEVAKHGRKHAIGLRATGVTRWWKDASDSERLAQIDGGQECGMTVRQIAMNLRLNSSTGYRMLRNYMQRFDRSTKATYESYAASGSKGGTIQVRRKLRAMGLYSELEILERIDVLNNEQKALEIESLLDRREDD